MSEIFHPCSLCNAHASFYKDPEQSIREAIALEVEQKAIEIMKSEIYTYNDTAVMAKTCYLIARDVVKKDGTQPRLH